MSGVCQRKKAAFFEEFLHAANQIFGGFYDYSEAEFVDDDTEIIRVVSTVRTDPRKGLISRESPFGKQVLGKKVGTASPCR